MRAGVFGGIAGGLVAVLVVVAASAAGVFDGDLADSSGPISDVTLGTLAHTGTKPLSLAETDLRGLLARVRPGIVRVTIRGDAGGGEGTGFIVGSDGVIVTNAHVAAGATDIAVTLSDGDVEQAELLGADPFNDLAVIKIDRRGLPALTLGDSDPPTTQVGDGVIAVGNALGLAGELSVTTGIVSALDRTLDIGDSHLVAVIQTDAAINPGNSGGPLMNTHGEVIGINTAIANPDEASGVGFAISISSARPVIEALRAGEEPQIAFLGVETESVTPQIAESKDLRTADGARITEIVAGSAAESAGLRVGDVVLAVDGETADGREALLREIRSRHVGEEIEIGIERDRTDVVITVKLGRRPKNDA